MAKIVTRKDWGARTPKRSISTRPVDEIVGITLHYTTGQELGNRNTRQWVRNTQNYHMDKLGYSDIAYNGLFDIYGNLFQGRDPKYLGAHSSSDSNNTANRTHLGLAFLGNDDPGVWDVTPRAIEAINLYVYTFMITYKKKPEIKIHREWKATQCPGDELAKVRDLIVWKIKSS